MPLCPSLTSAVRAAWHRYWAKMSKRWLILEPLQEAMSKKHPFHNFIDLDHLRQCAVLAHPAGTPSRYLPRQSGACVVAAPPDTCARASAASRYYPCIKTSIKAADSLKSEAEEELKKKGANPLGYGAAGIEQVINSKEPLVCVGPPFCSGPLVRWSCAGRAACTGGRLPAVVVVEMA